MNQKRTLKKLNSILKLIKEEQTKLADISDEELTGFTAVFKERLKNGENLDDLLVEAYAVVCEADKRILGMMPYDVQIIGGIALHKGYMCEMNTGEGKTLTATMPLYLNALTGRSTILVTTNEYLALRDAEEMGQVYNFLGLTVAAGVQRDTSKKFENDEKKEIYWSDIVYTTQASLGFDYLFNNLVKDADERFMRDFYYVIIDEADAVLLDSAQMPLVIAGSPRVQSNLYEMTDFFVSTLVEDEDYEIEDNKVWLTDKGIKYAEEYFKIDNFYSGDCFELNRHVNLALKAHTLYEAEKDYVISDDGELILLDGSSGRKMPGVKMRGGIHQAIEVKEGQKASQEMRSIASVTYQNLFGLFEKIGGMSGTISDTARELKEVYGVETLIIPTNKPVIRKDMKDRYFLMKDEQFDAAVSMVIKAHAVGQPVLVVVASIKETEIVSEMLIQEKVPHNVLNANNAFWEAEIIKEAGRMNAVTVSTSMAGRGTDIKLGKGVRELGGLLVVGIGRMSNIRMERQARGRAGRQGDPGISKFFVSIEDDIVTQSTPKTVEKLQKRKFKTGTRRLKKVIQGAQKLSEELAENGRKSSVDYDRVIKRQREIIYQTRNHLLDGVEISEEFVITYSRKTIHNYLTNNKIKDIHELNRYVLDNISYELYEDIPNPRQVKKAIEIENYLVEKVESNLKEKREEVGDEVFSVFLRHVVLTSIDDEWIEEVDYLQQLQAAVSGRATAQRNPVYEYQNDAFESYKVMEAAFYRNMMRNVMLSTVTLNDEGELSIVLP